MKEWKIRLTPEASRLASRLHPEHKKHIKQGLAELRRAPHTGKNLHEELSGFKSLRLKQYRVIYRINDKDDCIEIYHIGQRRDVYEQFRRLLSELQKS